MGIGTLYIVSAPSGGGKTSLVRALIKSLSAICVSISHTTRSMRPGDQEGVDYYFTNETQFKELIEQGAFLEHALVFGQHYGTSQQNVESLLAAGTDVILEIDWQGAQQIRKKIPGCISIFVLPPSRQILAERLHERAQDQQAVIEKRLALANEEIAHYREYDYLIVNDKFEAALVDMQAIVRANRLSLAKQEVKCADLLKELLN